MRRLGRTVPPQGEAMPGRPARGTAGFPTPAPIPTNGGSVDTTTLARTKFPPNPPSASTRRNWSK
eukprot:9878919-Prorocentrum_lima.AAC.1